MYNYKSVYMIIKTDKHSPEVGSCVKNVEDVNVIFQYGYVDFQISGFKEFPNICELQLQTRILS